MAFLMHMANIRGTSEIEPGWMNVFEFEWSAKRSVSAQTGGAYGRSSTFAAPQLSRVKVRRYADSVSALVWQEMVSGAVSQLQFKWLRTGPSEGPVAFFEATFESAKIINIGSYASEAFVPRETLEFTYKSVMFRLINIDDALTGTQDVVSYDLPMHSIQ